MHAIKIYLSITNGTTNKLGRHIMIYIIISLLYQCSIIFSHRVNHVKLLFGVPFFVIERYSKIIAIITACKY